MKTSLIILFIILTSCQTKKENSIFYCENEMKLIKPKKGIEIIKFNSRKDSIINILYRKFKPNGIETVYGIEIGDLLIKTYYVNVKNTTYLHKMHPVEINFNDKGKALINGNEIIEFDSIANWFRENFPIKEHLHLNKIRLDWDENISPNLLIKGIKEIINGYLISADNISKDKFEKQLCELNKNQLKIIEEILPFEFELQRFSNTEIYITE